MAEVTQCPNCGAVFVKEDIFCGECGAPRPSLEELGEPVASPPAEPIAGPEPPLPPLIPPTTSDARIPSSAKAGWRAAFIVLVVLGAIACVVGLAAFLVFGSMPSEATTPQEDWLYSAICCLLPIGGTGGLLLIAGLAIWYTRVRRH
jgi:hypothetical protein